MKGEKIESFRASEGQDFNSWIKKVEIHIKREKLDDEADKIDEIFLFLDGEPMRWFEEKQRLGSLPAKFELVKAELKTKFGEEKKQVCKMMNGDMNGYVRQFENLIQYFNPNEELKTELFRNGLDAKYFAMVAASTFTTYEKLKEFVMECHKRLTLEAPEVVSIFRASSRDDSVRRGQQDDRGSFGRYPGALDPNGRAAYGRYQGPPPPRPAIPEDMKRLYEQGLCFKCEQPGHRIADCPLWTAKPVKSAEEEVKGNGQH